MINELTEKVVFISAQNMMFIAKKAESWVIKLQGTKRHEQMVIILSDIDLLQHVQVYLWGLT